MYKGETMKENKEFALKVKSIRERQKSLQKKVM